MDQAGNVEPVPPARHVGDQQGELRRRLLVGSIACSPSQLGRSRTWSPRFGGLDGFSHFQAVLEYRKVFPGKALQLGILTGACLLLKQSHGLFVIGYLSLHILLVEPCPRELRNLLCSRLVSTVGLGWGGQRNAPAHRMVGVIVRDVLAAEA